VLIFEITLLGVVQLVIHLAVINKLGKVLIR